MSLRKLSRPSYHASKLVRSAICQVPHSSFSASCRTLEPVTKKDPASERIETGGQAILSKKTSNCRYLNEEVYKQLPRAMQMMTLIGKVIIVTGGARGLGFNMAEACAQAGAKAIIILDNRRELGEKAASQIHQASGETILVSFYEVDVCNIDDINGSFDKIVSRHGVPDVLINSAGIADSNMPAEKYDVKSFARLININLNGSFLVAQTFGKRLIEAKKPGSIVFIASMSGSIVNYPQEQSCYNASKAGVIMLGKSLAAEWAKYGIRVNMISPGYMNTALNNVPALDAQKKIWKSVTPQGRLGAIDDLNGLAILLASDASAYMTGSNVIIDGGYTLY